MHCWATKYSISWIELLGLLGIFAEDLGTDTRNNIITEAIQTRVYVCVVCRHPSIHRWCQAPSNSPVAHSMPQASSTQTPPSPPAPLWTHPTILHNPTPHISTARQTLLCMQRMHGVVPHLARRRTPHSRHSRGGLRRWCRGGTTTTASLRTPLRLIMLCMLRMLGMCNLISLCKVRVLPFHYVLFLMRTPDCIFLRILSVMYTFFLYCCPGK